MPGTKSDGSITIDTKLDNSGFTKGSKELKHAVESLTNQVNETGNKLQNAFKFDFGQPKQAVNSFSRAMKQVNNEIRGLGDLAKKALDGDADAMEEFWSESGETLDKLEEMKDALAEFGNADFLTPEYEKAAAEYEKAATQVDALAEALDNAEASFEKLTNNFGDSDEYKELEDRIEVLRMYQEEYDAAMKSGNLSAAARLYTDSGIGKGSFADAIKKAEDEMQKMWDKFENSASYKSAEKEIETITERLKQAETEAARCRAVMEDTPATFEGYDTTEYEKDQEALQKAIDKFLEYRQLVREGAGNGDSAAVSAGWSSFQESWQNVNISLSNITKNAKNAASSLGRIVTGSIASGLRRIADSAKSAATSLAGMAKNAVISGLKRVGNAISNIGRQSKSANKSLTGSFTTILGYALGIQSITALVSKMGSVIKEGFGNLAQYDVSFAQTVNNFKASLETLKNSFAAAFAPIAETILPLLTALTDKLTAIMSTVGQFIAALTGKTTYRRAITTQAAVAENTANAADAMDDEAQAAKEAKKELAGFDDVEILSDKNSPSDSGRAGGGGTATPGGGGGLGFETVPIDSEFLDLAKRIKDALKDWDFTEIGEMIGQKLTDALNSIDWDSIYKTAENFGKGLATFLNGLISPELFTAVGNTVAGALNTALHFLDSFGTWFDWTNFGKSIGAGLRAFFIRWDANLTADVFDKFVNGLAQTMIAALTEFPAFYVGNKISDSIKRALDGLNWTDIFTAVSLFGVKLAQFLNGLIKPDTFTSLGNTIGNFITLKLQFLDHFGETFNWINFGDSIAAGINGVFDNFKFAKLISTFVIWGLGLLDTITRALTGVDWLKIGRDIRDAILTIEFDKLLSRVGNVIFAAINASLDLASGLFDGTPVEDAIDGLKQTINDAVELIDFPSIVQGFKDLAEALKPFVEGFAIGLINIFDKIIEMGSALLSKLGPWLQSVANAIGSMDDSDLQTIGEGLGAVVGALVIFSGLNALSGIASKVSGALSGLFAACEAHPLMAIAAGLTAVAAGLGQMIDKGFFSDADTKAAIDNANKVIESAKEVESSVNDALDAIEGKDRDIKGTYTTLRNMSDEYFNLKTNASLTADQQKRLNELEKTLSDNLPGFTQIVGNTTKSYSDQQSAVNDLIKSTEDYYMTLAAQEFLQDYYKQLFDLEVQMQQLDDSNQELWDSYDVGAKNGNLLHDVLIEVEDVFDGTRQKVAENDAEYAKLQQRYQEVTAEGEAQIEVLKKHGIAVDDTTNSIGGLVTAEEDLGDTSATTSENTTDVGDAVKAFNGLGLDSSIKLALISGAIKLIGTNGKTTEENANKLYKALDEYKANPVDESMGEIAAAFDDAGVSTEDFLTALVQSLSGADKETQEAVKKVLSSTDALGPGLKASTEKAGKYADEGLADGIDDPKSKKKVQDATESVTKDDVLGTAEKSLNENSPSKEMQTIGEYASEGLAIGITAKASMVTSAITELMTSMKGIVSGCAPEFNTLGASLMESLDSGLGSGSSQLSSTASSVISGVYETFSSGGDWYSLGSNIGQGIYNGLVAQGAWLENLAWNTAVAMYNSACYALGIASPSKKFAWVGQMITEGLGGGIEATQDNAVDAVTSMAAAVMEEAEDASPIMQIDTAVGGIDEVLASFSDRVVSSFDNMVSAMEDIANGSSFALPVMAAGTVVPYSARRAATQSEADSLSTITSAMAMQNADRITRDELAEVLATALQQYLNIDFYIGDEQIARHANAGNTKLNRRYSPALS